MKLYTKSDLERAARLAATAALLYPKTNPEQHIADAVGVVSREAPEYYDEHTIRDVLGPEAVRALLERLEHQAKGN